MRKRSKRRYYIYLIIVAVLVWGLVKLLPEIEWSAPEVIISSDSQFIGPKPIEIEITDKGKGVKKVEITLNDANGDIELVNKVYDPPVSRDKIVLRLDPARIGVTEGKATLRIEAVDASRLRIFVGNKTVAKREFIIDFKPPSISAVTTEHFINAGGAGLVIYSTSDDVVKSGVELGGYFFPGYRGFFKNPNIGFALFAHPYDIAGDEPAMLFAEDRAGNIGRSHLPYYLRVKNFKKSTIKVSKRFIQRKMAPLAPLAPIASPASPSTAPSTAASENAEVKNLFLAVNRDLRRKNNNTIKEVTSKITPAFLWNGTFHQLSNSQVQANFADHRTYMYNNRKIDDEYHLGYDLAVVARYPVEAANSGRVAFSGELGIYGQSVIIDHGYGLFTLYSHMSSIDVKKGDRVEKSGIIGRTGQTGIAVGDHLHFGVYLDGVPVNPIEWWDATWLKNNIISPFEQGELEFGVSNKHKWFPPKEDEKGK